MESFGLPRIKETGIFGELVKGDVFERVFCFVFQMKRIKQNLIMKIFKTFLSSMSCLTTFFSNVNVQNVDAKKLVDMRKTSIVHCK